MIRKRTNTYTVRLVKIKAYWIPSLWEQLDQLRLSKQSIRLCNQLSDWSRCILITLFGSHCLSPGGEAWHTLVKGVYHNFVKCNFPARGDLEIPGEWPFPSGENVNAGFLKNFIENAGDSRRIREGWHVCEGNSIQNIMPITVNTCACYDFYFDRLNATIWVQF